MGQVYIVTDSTADIPKDLAKRLGITVVPLKIHFGEETYLDGETITSDAFFEKLVGSEHLPTTSQPSPVDFFNAYKALAEGKENVHIISIHLSSAMSGTFQSAALAQQMLEGQIDITVLDSKKASYAFGMIVVTVAEAAKAGKSKTYCVDLARYLIENTHVYFLVDTLKYLQKGGRIGKAASLIGSLLNIKPILSIDEMGVVYPKDKVRGNKKAMARILEFLQEDAAQYGKIRLGISHANAEAVAREYAESLKQAFGVEEVVITKIGGVIGAHVGPGTVAIALSADDFDA